MRCKHCESIIEEGSIFCSECGQKPSGDDFVDFDETSTATGSDYESFYDYDEYNSSENKIEPIAADDRPSSPGFRTERSKPAVNITTGDVMSAGGKTVDVIKGIATFIAKHLRITFNDVGLFIISTWMLMVLFISKNPILGILYMGLGIFLAMLPKSVYAPDGRRTFHFNHRCGGWITRKCCQCP